MQRHRTTAKVCAKCARVTVATRRVKGPKASEKPQGSADSDPSKLRVNLRYSLLDMRCHGLRKWCNHFYLGDQLGDSLWPDMVRRWACEPSASMVQIWRWPLRVDSKTMWRPSGAQLGRSFLPLSRVIWRISRLVGSMM